MMQMQAWHRVVSSKGRGLASAVAILTLGVALALGGCGTNSQTTGNGGNSTTTTQQTSTTTTTTTTGSTTPATPDGLQATIDSLESVYADLDSDLNVLNTNFTGQSQEVQP
jgi:hypothetical protein